ncbi:hypothetical protein Tco_0746712 [Tanacetum coccineum]
MSFFIGLQVSQSPRGIFINQSKYDLEMLKKYGLESSDVVETPMVERSKVDEDPQGTQVDLTCYRTMVGALMYLTATFADADHEDFQDTRWSTSGSATKHLTVCYHSIKEQVENEVVELYFVKTAYQLAHILTKALERERFKFLLNCLGMQSITPEKLKSLDELDDE